MGVLTGERKHVYQARQAEGCQRFACRVYKEGHRNGKAEGEAIGEARGHARGHSEGWAAGYAAGAASCGDG
jgi:hypothetical protein